jgi:hypothetical protein
MQLLAQHNGLVKYSVNLHNAVYEKRLLTFVLFYCDTPRHFHLTSPHITSSNTMCLLNLPSELTLLISNLLRPRNLNSLARTPR